MIGISTKIYDLQGARYFRRVELDIKTSNENNRRGRRVSRTATLAGGVFIYDTGYAPGDRDITVKVPAASGSIVDFLAYIVKNYSEIIVSTAEAVFLGDPILSYIDNDGSANLKINLIEKLGG